MSNMVSITLFYASILAILYVLLSLWVIRGRFRHRVALGHGDQPDLNLRIRVHGNFSEYVPIALVLMALFELQGARSTFLHGFGMLLVVARLLHAVGLGRTQLPSFGRFLGASITMLLIISAGFYGLYISRSIFE